jgi:hypothetical protein
MEKSFVLIVLSFAALATGGLIVNWVGLGRAMSRLSVSALSNSISTLITLLIPTCRSWLSVLLQEV